ncbi:uncharacterized protein L201_005010 [Kwoniella dendrophila CBS 6074]|uniref:Uncharacterized protein n=1 Tax=Kwoniella dendrophila CBS 6074 TaxID=1295534 RepID=A0AAX4JXL1_9TREE
MGKTPGYYTQAEFPRQSSTIPSEPGLSYDMSVYSTPTQVSEAATPWDLGDADPVIGEDVPSPPSEE